jgi:hypothetical protein
MADNVNYNPTGSTPIASDDVGGVQYQRIKPAFGVDGSATDVSLINPLPATITQGELIECLEAMRMALVSLNKTIGMTYPDTAGRLRVAIDAITASLTLATITTVTTVTTCSTLTNQSQIGGISANQQIPALLQISAESLRRNISVS